jgi:hypothetical protein
VELPSPEDHRGVDIWDIRDRLRLTPAERFQRMIEETRALLELQGLARRA